MASFIPGYATFVKAAAHALKEHPTTHESLVEDMESYLVAEATILDKVKKYVTPENINNAISSANANTLLTASIQNKRSLVAEYLIQNGADLNSSLNPLELALKNQCSTLVAPMLKQGVIAYLIQNGADLNSSLNPLELALKNQCFTLVAPMLKQGVILPNNDFSIVKTAIASGVDAKTLSLLVDNGAPIHPEAIISVFNNRELLSVLLTKLKGTNSFRPFNSWLVENKQIDLISELIEKKWFNVIRLFCEAGYQLNHENHLALIKSGKVDFIKDLINSGAFVVNSGQGKVFSTPLITAIQMAGENGSNGYQMVELLIKKGADVNVRNYETSNSSGTTPLLEAVKQGNKDLVELLCAANADTSMAGADGLTPLQLAVTKQQTSIVFALVKWSADVHVVTKNQDNLLHNTKNPLIVQYLAGQGVDLFQSNNSGVSPFVQLLQQEVSSKGVDNYDEILEFIYVQQRKQMDRVIQILDAKGTTNDFAEGSALQKSVDLVLSTFNTPAFQAHLKAKSADYQALIEDLRQSQEKILNYAQIAETRKDRAFKLFFQKVAASELVTTDTSADISLGSYKSSITAAIDEKSYGKFNEVVSQMGSSMQRVGRFVIKSGQFTDYYRIAQDALQEWQAIESQ